MKYLKAYWLISNFGLKDEIFTLDVQNTYITKGDIINIGDKKAKVHIGISGKSYHTSIYTLVCSELNWFGYLVYYISDFKDYICRIFKK